MEVVLLSTYELGRQPFGLASPAAFLRKDGHRVTCVDLAHDRAPLELISAASLIAFHLPMHTATRLAANLIPRVRALNGQAHLCCYGLYAPLNADYLRSLGVETLLGGEFEAGLRALAARLAQKDWRPQREPLITLERLDFPVPDRTGLPPPDRYALLEEGGQRRVTGYTEATRGCKHHCRHCPVVPIYKGTFRIIQRQTVLADIRQQINAGATHITFGDPDFFNGPTHAIRIVEDLHREFPSITYDVTIKIEHLLRHRQLLPVLERTGCRLVTSAVESIDNHVLSLLLKGHTREDFVEAVRLCRDCGLNLSPTFIPFTPWTTWESYRELLRTIVDLDLVDSVAPVQLALRLLVTANSSLLELEDIKSVTDRFDQKSLTWRWRHPDPSLDELADRLLHLVDREQKRGSPRSGIFTAIWECAYPGSGAPSLPDFRLVARAAVPFLTEPWYC